MGDWVLRERHRSSGGLLAYDVLGEGPPTVLIHGTPSWSYLWRQVAPALAHSRRVYVYDLLGYGGSDKRAGQAVSLAAQTALLVELLDHWGIGAPAVAGHDIGAAIALRAHLLKGRQYSHLALIDAVAIAPWITPFSRHVQEYLEAFETVPAPFTNSSSPRTYGPRSTARSTIRTSRRICGLG